MRCSRRINKEHEVKHKGESVCKSWVGHCYILDNRELWQQFSVSRMDNSTNTFPLLGAQQEAT